MSFEAIEIGRLYPPLKQIADTLTSSQKDLFVRLPGLLAYWPCGIRSATATLIEHTGNSLHLTQVGTNETGYDGNSYTHLGNGTNYFYSTHPQFAVDGLETFIEPSIRGLTLGGWFLTDGSGITNTGMLGRDNLSPNRGYSLYWTPTATPSFLMSSTGANVLVATGPATSLGPWHFIVGRFTPSTEVAIFVDGVKVENTTAIPASINISTAQFELGRYLTDNNRTFHGRARDVFICQAALSDALIRLLQASSSP